MKRNYSDQFYNFAQALCYENVKVDQFHSYIGSKFFAQFDSILKEYDYLEDELGKEIHNGRLFRLICKLGMICDRSHLGKDTTWSETGDRYQLKLFRDFLFHQVINLFCQMFISLLTIYIFLFIYQVTSDNQPWIDMGHVVLALNKLDAGVQEPICLVSPDERIVLIQTYLELKQCLRRAWHDLLQAAHPGGNAALGIPPQQSVGGGAGVYQSHHGGSRGGMGEPR